MAEMVLSDKSFKYPPPLVSALREAPPSINAVSPRSAPKFTPVTQPIRNEPSTILAGEEDVIESLLAVHHQLNQLMGAVGNVDSGEMTREMDQIVCEAEDMNEPVPVVLIDDRQDWQFDQDALARRAYVDIRQDLHSSQSEFWRGVHSAGVRLYRNNTNNNSQ